MREADKPFTFAMALVPREHNAVLYLVCADALLLLGKCMIALSIRQSALIDSVICAGVRNAIRRVFQSPRSRWPSRVVAATEERLSVPPRARSSKPPSANLLRPLDCLVSDFFCPLEDIRVDDHASDHEAPWEAA